MHTAPELHPIPVKSPWNHIGIHFVGPLVKSKSEYLANCKGDPLTNTHTHSHLAKCEGTSPTFKSPAVQFIIPPRQTSWWACTHSLIHLYSILADIYENGFAQDHYNRQWHRIQKRIKQAPYGSPRYRSPADNNVPSTDL